MGRTTHKTLFAIDAVNGSLDLFTFPRIPDAKDFISVHTKNYVAPSLQASDAEALLRQKVLRVIFQQGFFKVRDLNLEIAREPLELHVPYWLGFYGHVAARCRTGVAARQSAVPPVGR